MALAAMAVPVVVAVPVEARLERMPKAVLASME
jgi:hypothetical protein